ncbi:MAG TPA: NRDE family protein, partial [Candidatus Binatus sp.]|nr:NRDE family protein [Candidatus Binatus sp.]
WLGVNEYGLTVGILNRRINGTTLPEAVSRSRGLLCHDLLERESAAAAAVTLAEDKARYNPFTLIFADDKRAYVAYNNDPAIITLELATGLHVFSSAAEVDLRSTKADRAQLLFYALTSHDAARSSEPRHLLAPLQKILADHSLNDGSADPGDAICVHREVSGTVSSSVIFFDPAKRRFETFHCQGAPCQNSFGASLHLPLR